MDIQTRLEINCQKCKLVKKAERLINEMEFVDESNPKLPKLFDNNRNHPQLYTEIKDSQFRNVQNIANTEQCVPVITNFIKYQIGRHSEWRFKGRKYNDKKENLNFGEELITYILKLEEDVDEIRERFKKKGIIKEFSEEEKEEIHIILARLFLGYLSRYVKYKETFFNELINLKKQKDKGR